MSKRNVTREKYYLREEKWQKGIQVKNEARTRPFRESIYFIRKTGSQCRELPYYYGKGRSVYNAMNPSVVKVFRKLISQGSSKDYDVNPS